MYRNNVCHVGETTCDMYRKQLVLCRGNNVFHVHETLNDAYRLHFRSVYIEVVHARPCPRNPAFSISSRAIWNNLIPADAVLHKVLFE